MRLFRRERKPDSLLSIYFYSLPQAYKPDPHHLETLTQTYFDIYKFLKRFETKDPNKADYFFVPIHLAQFQFENRELGDFFRYLKFYKKGLKKHIIVGIGDFSQRSRKNHFGTAYKHLYEWLDGFKIIALEATSDLIDGQDLSYIPANTFVTREDLNFKAESKPYLYSFLGTINHHFLPETHARKKLGKMAQYSDSLIAEKLSLEIRDALPGNTSIPDDYELVAKNSTFTLCVAGYGKWTYRFFQSIKWDSIPVLISDDYTPPFNAFIPYHEFMIRIPEKDILNADKVLRSLSQDEIDKMKKALRKHKYRFTSGFVHECLTIELLAGLSQ